MISGRQTTLAELVQIFGSGVHSDAAVTLTLHPADIDSGYRLLRTGRAGLPDQQIEIRADAVSATELATVLGDRHGALCATTEHVLAALRGLAIDNVLIEVDGPEMPIMDGSAAAFVAMIDRAGVRVQSASRRFIRVLKPVRVTREDGAFCEFLPNAGGFRIETEIAFNNPVIGRQAVAFDVTPEVFRKEIARARTFGFMDDVSRLWAAGYARGASLDNTVVVDKTRVLNVEGLRYADEFVRHKALDAIGDLALAGLPLLATYRSFRGGHRLNHAAVTALLADRSAWTITETATADRRARSNIRGHAEVGTALAAPVFRPEVA